MLLGARRCAPNVLCQWCIKKHHRQKLRHVVHAGLQEATPGVPVVFHSRRVELAPRPACEDLVVPIRGQSLNDQLTLHRHFRLFDGRRRSQARSRGIHLRRSETLCQRWRIREQVLPRRRSHIRLAGDLCHVVEVGELHRCVLAVRPLHHHARQRARPDQKRIRKPKRGRSAANSGEDGIQIEQFDRLARFILSIEVDVPSYRTDPVRVNRLRETAHGENSNRTHPASFKSDSSFQDSRS